FTRGRSQIAHVRVTLDFVTLTAAATIAPSVGIHRVWTTEATGRTRCRAYVGLWRSRLGVRPEREAKAWMGQNRVGDRRQLPRHGGRHGRPRRNGESGDRRARGEGLGRPDRSRPDQGVHVRLERLATLDAPKH